MSEKITVETVRSTAWIMLTDEKNLNAFSSKMVDELEDAVRKVENMEDIHVVVIGGTGRAFIAGADIKLMQNLSPMEAHEYAERTYRIYNLIENSKKCYIAMVNGYAFGAGFELSLACDFRIGSEKASFQLPEVSLGIIPGGGGTQKLVRFVGEGRAKELILLGKRIDAATALSYGLLTEVTSHEKLTERTTELAERLCRNSSVGVAMAKRAVNAARNIHVDEGVSFERQSFAICFSEEDQKRLMMAFANNGKKNQ